MHNSDVEFTIIHPPLISSLVQDVQNEIPRYFEEQLAQEAVEQSPVATQVNYHPIQPIQPLFPRIDNFGYPQNVPYYHPQFMLSPGYNLMGQSFVNNYATMMNTAQPAEVDPTAY